MNAKQEFLDHTKSERIYCARIGRDENWDGVQEWIILPVDYSSKQWEEFLQKLDFQYDDSYGSQQLFGNIWYGGSKWSSRGEYDGSEWWQFNECPEIPQELQ